MKDYDKKICSKCQGRTSKCPLGKKILNRKLSREVVRLERFEVAEPNTIRPDFKYHYFYWDYCVYQFDLRPFSRDVRPLVDPDAPGFERAVRNVFDSARFYDSEGRRWVIEEDISLDFVLSSLS